MGRHKLTVSEGFGTGQSPLSSGVEAGDVPLLLCRKSPKPYTIVFACDTLLDMGHELGSVTILFEVYPRAVSRLVINGLRQAPTENYKENWATLHYRLECDMKET